MKHFTQTLLSGLSVLLIAPLLAAPSVAQAEQTSVEAKVERDVERAPHAWLYLHELEEEYLTAKQRTMVSHLAYHGTVSLLCEGIALNRPEFDRSIQALEHEQMDGLTDDEYALHHQKILISYGAALGVMLAEHAHDAADFCTEAELYIAENPQDHLFDMEKF